MAEKPVRPGIWRIQQPLPSTTNSVSRRLPDCAVLGQPAIGLLMCNVLSSENTTGISRPGNRAKSARPRYALYPTDNYDPVHGCTTVTSHLDHIGKPRTIVFSTGLHGLSAGLPGGGPALRGRPGCVRAPAWRPAGGCQQWRLPNQGSGPKPEQRGRLERRACQDDSRASPSTSPTWGARKLIAPAPRSRR